MRKYYVKRISLVLVPLVVMLALLRWQQNEHDGMSRLLTRDKRTNDVHYTNGKDEPHNQDEAITLKYSPRRTPLPSCSSPRHHLAYIKVQKTGGTTLCDHILEPYGLKRNISFLLAYRGIYHLNFPKDILPNEVLPPLKTHHEFLTQEARYNAKVLQQLMPQDTVYIFSLRKPIDRFLSTFYFTNSHKLMKSLFNIQDPEAILEAFLSEPESMRKLMLEQAMKDGHICPYAENAMIGPSSQGFCLGIDDGNNRQDIHEQVKQIVSEFEIFVLTEYFDESMILLKRTMCWTLEDVLYSKILNSRKSNEEHLTERTISDTLRSKILEYNRADVILYDHANKTFWEKIRQEEGFYEELDDYREMVKRFSDYCSRKTKNKTKEKFTKKCVYHASSSIVDIHRRQRTQGLLTLGQLLSKRLKILNLTLETDN